MNKTYKITIQTGNWTKGYTFFAFPPILLILFIVALLALMISTCIKFTKGPLSTKALLQRLQLLQSHFMLGTTINPETERQEMETLQNKIKTSSEAAVISGDAGLKQLFVSNCNSIQAVLGQPDLQNRTAWIKLNALMVDFNSQYFQGKDQ